MDFEIKQILTERFKEKDTWESKQQFLREWDKIICELWREVNEEKNIDDKLKTKYDKCDFCGKQKLLMGSWINWELGEEYHYCSTCLGEIEK